MLSRKPHKSKSYLGLSLPWNHCRHFRRLAACTLLLAGFNLAQARFHSFTIPVGKGPADVIVNPATNKIYTADARSGSVTVVDGNSNLVVARIPLPCRPVAICCNQYTNKVYCSSASGPYIAIVDGNRDSLIACLYLGRGILVTALCNNSSNNDVYCASHDQVLVIDGITNEVAEIVSVEPNHYRALCYNPANNRIYCVGDSAPAVTVIDCAKNTGAKAIPTGAIHHALCWDRRGNRLYCAGIGRVDVIDCNQNKVMSTITLPDSAPRSVCCNSANNKVYCPSGSKLNTVLVIDCATGDVASLRAGNDPFAAVADPVRNRVLVANRQSRDVTQIDGSASGPKPKAFPRTATGTLPAAITLNPVTGVAYVANSQDNTVSVVVDSPFEIDIRISDIKRRQWVSPFGSNMLVPTVVLGSNGLAPSGFALSIEIFDITNPKIAVRVPVYAESLVVWDMMTRKNANVKFPEFSPDPGTYEVVARIVGMPDADPAGNRRTTTWKFAEPVPKK